MGAITPYDRLHAKPFKLIDNYIYMYHIEKFFILPSFPDSIQDSIRASYSSNTPLARSAPIFAYSNSGPRSITVNLKLHRDMMNSINIGNSNLKLETDDEYNDEDYVDKLVNYLQAIALPNYDSAKRMVDPPKVAVRFGDDIFIKGIVDGGITLTKSGPILANPLNSNSGSGNRGKYAVIDISFTVTEIDPYSANQMGVLGSMRGLDKDIESKFNWGKSTL